MKAKDYRRQFRFLAGIAIIAMFLGLIIEIVGKEGFKLWVVASLVLAVSAWFYADWKIEDLKEEMTGETTQ